MKCLISSNILSSRTFQKKSKANRYLDWNSLFSQPKTILPLHIVQNLAKLSKEDVSINV